VTATNERQAALATIERRRERHRERSMVVRAGLMVVGFVAVLAAIPLVVIFFEIGLPLLIVGIGLLALEFDVAAKVFAWLVWRSGQAKRWFAAQPWPVKTAIVVACAAFTAGVVLLLVLH
jgi:hypothetical protein